MNRIAPLSILFAIMLLSGCANRSTLLLPSAGTWTADTVLLGPVVACRGGNLDFTAQHKECNQWPLSIPSLPHPDTHHAELRTKAAQQYQTDVSMIVLKDVAVTYNAELVGIIRGWKATAIAGKNPK
jgi:hypothetical protein